MKPSYYARIILLISALIAVGVGNGGCTLLGSSAVKPLTACNLPIVAHTGFVSPLKLGLNIPYDVDIMQNEGQVCIRTTNADASAMNLEFTVSSSGCYSSSCSVPYERTGELYIDREGKKIQFFSRFMVKEYGGSVGSCGCTGDCGGAGVIVYTVDDLSAGVYQLKLGLKTIGEITLPFQPGPSSECFSTEKTN